MKTILITGSEGMLGSDAADFFFKSGYKVIKATRKDFDITSLEEVIKFFSEVDLDFVLHAAAYTEVDQSENNKDLFLVNAEGARNVAIASNKQSIPIIYVSTDYVFDGKKESPYLVTDKPNPINIYGKSKLLGEELVKKENAKNYIIRASWLYGENGKNFVDTMVSLSKTQKVIRVVDDQIACPTSTYSFSKGVEELISNNSSFGTYHICNAGYVSWFKFAEKIFEILNIDIELIPIPTKDFKSLVDRPKFSAMKSNIVLSSWENSLNEYLTKKFAN